MKDETSEWKLAPTTATKSLPEGRHGFSGEKVPSIMEKENKAWDSALGNSLIAFSLQSGSYVVDGVLMGDKSLISNEEQIFKKCARF